MFDAFSERDGRGVHNFLNLSPQIVQTITAVIIPQMKSPRVPKVVPVNGNHSGEHKPTAEQNAIIKINFLLAPCCWPVAGSTAASAEITAACFSIFCFLMR